MNLATLLVRAIVEHGRQLQLYAVTPNVSEMRRAKGAKPATLTVQVPDETVKNLRGKPEERDLLICLRVPREIVAKLESPLVLPPSMAPGPADGVPLIVRPNGATH